jgi:hypothetical protein
MKFNKWTLGLAALGAVSLASVAQAEEKSVVQTALTSTTISGYVDTSMQWNVGTGNANLPNYSGSTGKADGFNLNVVQLTIAKALDESEWAAGYRADIWFGPDANNILANQSTTGGDLAIRQAYVALRTPVGNGIDWKIGVFDTVVGYESLESGSNPNYTHSYGFTFEPTTHTGLLGTYRFNDSISASAGVANTFGPTINQRGNNGTAESFKTYLGSIALTAPSDWGWVAGSSLYAGLVTGQDNGALGGTGAHRTHYYVGATVATPVTGFKVGTAIDYSHLRHVAAAPANVDDNYAMAIYASLQATEKLSVHGRAEYVVAESSDSTRNDGFELTGTVQYDLWQNVISRAEIRWDHSDTDAFGDNGDLKNEVMVAANIIYKF